MILSYDKAGGHDGVSEKFSENSSVEMTNFRHVMFIL